MREWEGQGQTAALPMEDPAGPLATGPESRAVARIEARRRACRGQELVLVLLPGLAPTSSRERRRGGPADLESGWVTADSRLGTLRHGDLVAGRTDRSGRPGGPDVPRFLCEGLAMMEPSRITMDPEICGGRPCIRGMRIRVNDVLAMLAAGVTHQEILEDYPYLEEADILASLDFAARQTDHPVLRVA